MVRHQGQLDGIEVNDLCTADGAQIDMDRGRLMQVWINLLLNARDAMLERSVLEISSQREGDTIKVSVCDEGQGIEQDAMKRIFEPFFTTKAPGSGYGLGLAVCQRIIDESGGTITVRSNPGKGTCFTVSLPCITERLS
jgi:signal transduction histidine kinase